MNPNELLVTLAELHTLFDKAEITKVHFVRNDFAGTSKDYEIIKNMISKQFENSKTHFLFLKDKITLLQNREEIKQSDTEWHIKSVNSINGWVCVRMCKIMSEIAKFVS